MHECIWVRAQPLPAWRRLSSLVMCKLVTSHADGTAALISLFWQWCSNVLRKQTQPSAAATGCLLCRASCSFSCRGNNFTGPLDLRKCTQLQLADLQGNRFSGPLPVDGRNRALSVLRADHNSFNGSVPLGIWDLPSLMALELTNNRYVSVCVCVFWPRVLSSRHV